VIGSADARAAVVVALVVAGVAFPACGTEGGRSGDAVADSTAHEGLPKGMRVPRIGSGPRYRPKPAGALAALAALVTSGGPIGDLRCIPAAGERFGAHLEIFAREIDVVIPAGIGIAPPLRRDGAYVRGGRCSYPARTVEPTGLIEVEKGSSLTLGDFFDMWGQPLSSSRVLTFRARSGRRVSAFVDGRRWHGSPRSIPLQRHKAIVVEVGGYFPPTESYLFPPGL
jgi:hypothetical protein